MTKKILLGLGAALLLLIAQFGTVLAAQEPTPLIGTVNSVTPDTDPTTGETTYLVELVVDGTTQTVRLSLQTATDLGLVSTDTATGVTTVNDGAIGTTVQIDPTLIIPDETSTTEEEDQHPVGSALADFFTELFGVDYETIMDYHDDGVGFGVIAQALWMTERLDGDTETFQLILDAKKSGNYSTVTLEDGSTPENWGQFKKAVMGTGSHENLGSIMSGKDQDTSEQASPGNGRGPGNGHGPGQGNGNNQSNKDKDKNKNKP